MSARRLPRGIASRGYLLRRSAASPTAAAGQVRDGDASTSRNNALLPPRLDRRSFIGLGGFASDIRGGDKGFNYYARSCGDGDGWRRTHDPDRAFSSAADGDVGALNQESKLVNMI